MKGNALQPGNYQRLLKARRRLAILKTVKLNRRAGKYENTEAGLLALMKHLFDETREASEECFNYSDAEPETSVIDYKALAFEIADVSNCCDLVLMEILDYLDKPLKTPAPGQAQTVTPENPTQ